MYFEELLAAMLMACVVAGSSVSNSPHIVLPHKLGGQLAHIDLRAACRWICNLGRLHSLRSLVVERQNCNLKVLGSIPSEGYSNYVKLRYVTFRCVTLRYVTLRCATLR